MSLWDLIQHEDGFGSLRRHLFENMTLHELYIKHKKGDWPDKGSVHSYIDAYAELLEPYRYTAKNILEVGLMSGESLRMWEDYFSGNVYGMDCDLTPIGGLADLRPMLLEGGHNIFIGDAASNVDAEKFFSGITFDVIIEDAGHELSQQLGIYYNMKRFLSPNGIYIIEDVQDIDNDRAAFEFIDPKRKVEILDRRDLKGRYDDVMIVIK